MAAPPSRQSRSVARYWAVIASAGGGTRMAMGKPKQYLSVRGRALVEWSIAPFLDAGWIDGVTVVLSKGDTEFARLPIARHPKILTVAGGPTRAESVLAGLRAVAENTGWTQTGGNGAAAVFALVHDAARPCVTVDDIETLRDEASDDDGGLLALPVIDTLKQELRDRAAATVDRAQLWRAQTPQLFRADRLRSALEAGIAEGAPLTDEASAMERAGARPLLVRGRESNLKVTYPEDLPLAEFWLSRQDYLR